jgi:hypothetical protein
LTLNPTQKLGNNIILKDKTINNKDINKLKNKFKGFRKL